MANGSQRPRTLLDMIRRGRPIGISGWGSGVVQASPSSTQPVSEMENAADDALASPEVEEGPGVGESHGRNDELSPYEHQISEMTEPELRDAIGCASSESLEDVYSAASDPTIPLGAIGIDPCMAGNDSNKDELDSFPTDLLEADLFLHREHKKQQADLDLTFEKLKRLGDDLSVKHDAVRASASVPPESPVIVQKTLVSVDLVEEAWERCSRQPQLEIDISDGESSEDEGEEGARDSKMDRDELIVAQIASSRCCEKERRESFSCGEAGCRKGSQHLKKCYNVVPMKIVKKLACHAEPENCTELKCWVPGCSAISIGSADVEFEEKLREYRKYLTGIPKMVSKLSFLDQELVITLPSWYNPDHLVEGRDWGSRLRVQKYSDAILALPSTFVSKYNWIIKKSVFYTDMRALSFRDVMGRIAELCQREWGTDDNHLIPHVGYQLYNSPSQQYEAIMITKHEGYPLKEVLNSSKMPDFCSWLHQFVDIAEFLNNCGIVYPGWTVNKFVVTSFEPFVMKLVDFSQAVCASERSMDVWEDVRLSISPAIVPPELYEASGTPAVHIWGIACTVFQIACGHMIRHNARHNNIRPEQLRDEISRSPEVDLSCVKDERLRRLLKRCFQVSPGDRPTCDQLHDMIESTLNGNRVHHYATVCQHIIPDP